MTAAFCLSFHASYACRHAGACCEADWMIPAEPEVIRLVEARGIGRPDGGGQRFAAGGLAGAADPVVARHPGGACVFFEPAAGRLCSIHREAGEAALPSACRHFPRVVLHDDRGLFVSLSHFCPAAAGLLVKDIDIEIVEAPASLALPMLEGFEARGALPPLLRPGLLMDLGGYAAWEAAAVRTFGRFDITPWQALAAVSAATERVRAWKPGGVISLEHTVAAAFADRQSATAIDPPAILAGYERALGRYLAARVFGNRIAYEARGLRTVVAWLRACLEAVTAEAHARAAVGHLDTATFVEAIRAADLKQVHAGDTRAFAREAAGSIEGGYRL